MASLISACVTRDLSHKRSASETGQGIKSLDRHSLAFIRYRARCEMRESGFVIGCSHGPRG